MRPAEEREFDDVVERIAAHSVEWLHLGMNRAPEVRQHKYLKCRKKIYGSLADKGYYFQQRHRGIKSLFLCCIVLCYIWRMEGTTVIGVSYVYIKVGESMLKVIVSLANRLLNNNVTRSHSKTMQHFLEYHFLSEFPQFLTHQRENIACLSNCSLLLMASNPSSIINGFCTLSKASTSFL